MSEKNKNTKEKIGAVLVVGGGISGIQSALDLANSGFKTYIVEKSSAIGGVMAQLDKTFPTNDCSMCILAPKLVEVGQHNNIHLLTNSEVTKIEGDEGNFSVTILKHPRFVNETKCVGCGICAEKCPKKVHNEFDVGLSTRKAIYIKYLQAVPLKYTIDNKACIYFKTGKCRNCEKHCPAGAINFDQKEEIINLNVGSIIISPGFSLSEVPVEYRYGLYPNVVTSLEFERMLSASGPYGGSILRQSDKKEPKKIAFIQCVGSRDKRNEYCSSVCCMYAIKESIIAKEHNPHIDISIFFIDLRAFGKEFEYYYKRAENENIKFIRSRVAEIMETETRNLILRYSKDEEIKEEEFDLVVLSVGLKSSPPPISGLKLNKYGFCHTTLFNSLQTSIPGIYVSGGFSGPKDIPETVVQSSGAVAKASSIISSERGKLTTVKEFFPEKDVSSVPPRIGVFVCHCGINIGGVVNVPEVVRYVQTLPEVVYAEENLYTCSQDTQEKIKKMIKKHELNRIVVASCTPRTHGQLFQNTIREAGLNPYLFEMANIREQCSWVHTDKAKATEKSKILVRMAVLKVRLLEPLKRSSLPVTQTALVVGGGLSGLTAALELANHGLEVHLIEKNDKLGGNLRRIRFTLTNEDPQKHLTNLIKNVMSNKNKIHVHTSATVETVEGFVGNFRTTLSTGEVINHGAVIIATGGIEYKPVEYYYGQNKNVLTQLELEEKLAARDFKAHTVVMIQCVGSRTAERGYCSRICCSHAIKNALKIKELYPQTNVYVLYKDIRTYGFREEFYKASAEKGIVFIRYDDNNKPVVTPDLEVEIIDSITADVVKIRPDILVLSPAVLPNPDNDSISKLFKIPLSRDKFFLEAHMKLRPVEFTTEGIFLCGLAHSPRFIDEAIGQACAAVSKALILLSKGFVEIGGPIAVVDEDMCSFCLTCVRVCPFQAPFINERGVAEISEALCQGCGTCAAECPAKAIQLRHYKDIQILSKSAGLLAEVCMAENGGEYR